jgi:hypothetical protein
MLGEILALWLMGQVGALCRNPQMDWCVPYLDDPHSSATAPRYGLERSLLAAQIIEIGSSSTLTGDLFPAESDGTYGQAYAPAYRWVHQRRREIAAATGKRVPKRYKAMRFDILAPQQLARAVREDSLDWKCLLEAEDQLPEVITMMTDTQEPDYQWNYNYKGAAVADDLNCLNASAAAVACEFVTSTNGGLTPGATGNGLLKQLCLQGGGTDCNNAYKRVIYYIGRGLTDRHTAAAAGTDGKYEMNATAVRFKQNDVDCAAWLAADAKLQIEAEDYDGVQLNYKPDFRWIGSPEAPALDALSVYRAAEGCADDAGTSCNANWMQQPGSIHADASTEPTQMFDTPTSSVPKGCAGNAQDLHSPWNPTNSGGSACTYRETDYAQGIKMTADALTAAGVKYHLLWTGRMLSPLGSEYDDTDTVVNEETAYFDPAALGADRAAIETSQPSVPSADQAAILAAFPTSYMVRTSCGKTTPEVACEPLGTDASVTLFPTFAKAGNDITWGPWEGTNSPTGTWSGKIFANCPAVNATTSPTAAGCASAVATPSGIADGTTQTSTVTGTSGHRIAFEVTQGTTCGDGDDPCTAWDWYDIP